METGEELTVKGQKVVDLADPSIFNRQDVQRRGAVDSLLIHLIDREGGGTVGAHRFKPDFERIHAPEEESIEECLNVRAAWDDTSDCF